MYVFLSYKKGKKYQAYQQNKEKPKLRVVVQERNDELSNLVTIQNKLDKI